MIAKKQKMAQQQAKTLINFENIIVDTDFGGSISFRHSVIGGKLNDSGGEPDNADIFELKEFDKEGSKPKKQSFKTQLKGSFMGKESAKKSIEMGKLNKMQHYVIDDNSDEEDNATAQASANKQADKGASKTGGNRPAREIVFNDDDL